LFLQAAGDRNRRVDVLAPRRWCIARDGCLIDRYNSPRIVAIVFVACANRGERRCCYGRGDDVCRHAAFIRKRPAESYGSVELPAYRRRSSQPRRLTREFSIDERPQREIMLREEPHAAAG